MSRVIKVKTLGNQTLNINFSKNDQIIKIKQSIEKLTTHPPERQKLFLKGKELSNFDTLEKIEDSNIDHLLLLIDTMSKNKSNRQSYLEKSPMVPRSEAFDSPNTLFPQKDFETANESIKYRQIVKKSITLNLQNELSNNHFEKEIKDPTKINFTHDQFLQGMIPDNNDRLINARDFSSTDLNAFKNQNEVYNYFDFSTKTTSSQKLILDRSLLINLCTVDIQEHEYLEIEELVSSPMFLRVQKEATKSTKSLLNLLAFLRENYPSIFYLFLDQPEILEMVLYGHVLRFENDFVHVSF